MQQGRSPSCDSIRESRPSATAPSASSGKAFLSQRCGLKPNAYIETRHGHLCRVFSECLRGIIAKRYNDPAASLALLRINLRSAAARATSLTLRILLAQRRADMYG